MTWLQAVVTVIVAIVSSLGGSYFGYKQFLLKRKDEKEEKTTQKLIDASIDKLKEEMQEQFNKLLTDCGEIGEASIDKTRKELQEEMEKGLQMRGEEGRERFEINSKQIEQNTEMIKQVITMQKKSDEKFDKLADSLTALNNAMTINAKVTKACAEGARSTIYDRILLVANNALKRGAITITEKTNLKQLYNSWQELQGTDPKITTYVEDCMDLQSIPDE